MYKAIQFVEKIISSDEPWTDEKFPPNQTSLFNDDDSEENIKTMKRNATPCSWFRT